jgi:hypothetical protein
VIGAFRCHIDGSKTSASESTIPAAARQFFGMLSASVWFPAFFLDATCQRLLVTQCSERDTMLKELDALSIARLHEQMLLVPERRSAQLPDTRPGVWHWIETNHRYNALLWGEEDKARRTDVGSAEIAASKRLIDQYNQKRNDAVEAIDEAILSQLDACPRLADARLHSETAGAMTDRLSILCLKIHYMREQTERRDAGAEHIANCSAKLQRLIAQRQDLGFCLDQLLLDASQGRAYFKVYRQFKMYNDPTLNPYLYGQPDRLARGGAAP